MENMRTIIVWSSLPVFLALGVGVYATHELGTRSSTLSETREVLPHDSAPVSEEKSPEQEVVQDAKGPRAEVVTLGSLATTTPENLTATLIVSGNEYPVSLHEGETVRGVMDELVIQKKLSYGGKDFSDLGFFVDTINDKKSTGGMYWILYVNGVPASLGVSQLVVKSGDRIEWRYEKEK